MIAASRGSVTFLGYRCAPMRRSSLVYATIPSEGFKTVPRRQSDLIAKSIPYPGKQHVTEIPKAFDTIFMIVNATFHCRQ
jgi:hypothetical protein